MNQDWETDCLNSVDEQHCYCWYDGYKCCYCHEPADPEIVEQNKY